MVAGHDPVVLGDADRALQLGADGEDRPTRLGTAGAAARARSRASGAAPADAPAWPAPPSRRSGCGSAGRAAGGRRPADRAVPTASSSSWAIGSSLRLPLVITSGRPTPRQQQVVQRAVRQHQARAREARARRRRRRRCPARRGASTIGRRIDVSAAAAPSSSSQSSLRRRRAIGDHHRERLVVACLAPPQLGDRRLVRGVGHEVVAADALHRDDAPGAIAAIAASSGRRAPLTGVAVPARATSAADRTPGRRWAEHGTAGRPGRRTRPGTRAHIAKPAIVVAGRSYGTLSTIVYRGPQLVQFVNGVAVAPVGRDRRPRRGSRRTSSCRC